MYFKRDRCIANARFYDYYRRCGEDDWDEDPVDVGHDPRGVFLWGGVGVKKRRLPFGGTIRAANGGPGFGVWGLWVGVKG